MSNNVVTKEESKKLPLEFVNAIHNIRNFLENLKAISDVKIITDFEKCDYSLFNNLLEKWVEVYRSFETEVEQLSKSHIKDSVEFVRKELHNLLLDAPFVHRAFTKPRGYAGDYEMMNMLLHPKPMGEENYAKLVHLLNIMPGIPESVRNRNDLMLKYLSDYHKKNIKEEPFKILSVACGPAWEIERFLSTQPDGNIEITLVDHDIEALEYASLMLKSVIESSRLDVVVKTEHVSVFVLLKEAREGVLRYEPESYNVVYSAGIMDYLNDCTCNELISYLNNYVCSNGIFFTTNMHPKNTEKFWMEYIFDWRLIYRNREDLLRIAPDKNAHVFADHTGINMFMEIKQDSQ